MKKNLILTICLTSALLLSNSATAQFHFGVKAGLNLANFDFNDDYSSFYEDEFFEEKFTSKMTPSFLVGVQAEYRFSPSVGLGLGVQVSGKGYKIRETFTDFGESFDYSEQSKPMYLQVPLWFQYRNSGFFAAVGPYFAWGIGGNYKVEVEGDGDSYEDDGSIEFTDGFDVDDYGDFPLFTSKLSPMDIGAGLELGYEFGQIRVTASFNQGFSNLIPKDLVTEAKEEADLDFKVTNRVIGLSAAYIFGK